MEGESISRRGGLIVERESMRIVRSATVDPEIPSMSFQATPAGRPATSFAWVPSDAPGLTFLNAAHDYPQRIQYWREGRHLIAEIAAADGSKSRRWRYSPSRC